MVPYYYETNILRFTYIIKTHGKRFITGCKHNLTLLIVSDPFALASNKVSQERILPQAESVDFLANSNAGQHLLTALI